MQAKEIAEEIKKIPTKLEECSSVECDFVYSGRIPPTFQRNMLNLSSEQMSNTVTMGI